jgi:hypothetical protein
MNLHILYLSNPPFTEPKNKKLKENYSVFCNQFKFFFIKICLLQAVVRI